MANSQKNTLIALAAIMVVVMGIIAILTIRKPSKAPTAFEREVSQITTQSNSDEVSAIEKDLAETDLDDLDKELKEIEAELEADD